MPTCVTDDKPALVQVCRADFDDGKRSHEVLLGRTNSLRRSATKSLKTWFKRERRGGANFTSTEIGNVGLDTIFLYYLKVEGVLLLDSDTRPNPADYCFPIRVLPKDGRGV